MPTELRHILFKPAEVVEAILAHRRMLKLNTPTGQLVESGIRDGAPGTPLAFVLRILPDRGAAKPFDITMEGAELTTALLAMCRDRRIPVPMRGAKGLMAFGSRVGLVVTLGTSDDQQEMGGVMKKMAVGT